MVLVTGGRLDIHIGFEVYELGPGDSMRLPSSVPHRYVNPGTATTHAVTVILHDG
jgi:mannose-6-phosphate isomerase-like protein (cupin superfamily)